MSLWRRTPSASFHPAGHKVGLFGKEWWVYPNGWPTLDARGPFASQAEAEEAMDTPQLLPHPPRYAEAPHA
ncbi:MAG TPA: hypothetical protein VJ623_05465 [Holophagaceae bacterium]|nr:hypothetical protein [Holophagaceae bacterium]